MAQWKPVFEIPTDKAQDVLDTTTDYWGYQEQIQDENGDLIDNPQTRQEFAFEKVRSFIKDSYKAGKAKDADSHRVTAIADAEAVDILVS